MSSSKLQYTTEHPDGLQSLSTRYRLSQETHETQICEGDPQELYKKCEKNPGHQKFISIADFATHHLPEGSQDQDCFDLIQALATLTVKVKVNSISPDRPMFMPGTKDPYPYHDKRGTKIKVFGSGKVAFVTKFTAKGKWRGEIEVYTANHVVFDEHEAQHTKVTLFYDTPGSEVVKLKGWTRSLTNVEADNCKIKCLINDVKLLDKLDESWTTWKSREEKVNKRCRCRDKAADIAIIVSHPHGCTKQISVGHVIDRETNGHEQGFILSKYWYTTCTCPGSSGAPLFMPGCKEYTRYGHRHSGSEHDNKNFSGYAWDEHVKQ